MSPKTGTENYQTNPQNVLLAERLSAVALSQKKYMPLPRLRLIENECRA